MISANVQRLVQTILDQIVGAARFRWTALTIAWIVCVLGWAIVPFMPNLYQASARVYVDTRTSLAPVLQGLTINQDINAQLNLVRQSLLGGAQLERVAKEAGVDLGNTPAARLRGLDQMRARMTADGRDSGGGIVFTLSYVSENRDTSLKVVDILINRFIEDTLGVKRTGSATAESFLREQIRDYEQRLRDAEERLADFKRRNVGQMPGAEGDYFTRLQQEMEAVEAVRAKLSIAVTRRDELARQLRGDAAGERVLAALATGDTSVQIEQTRKRLEELLLRYTDRHPDVIAARETLRQLEARREAEAEALRKGADAAILAKGADNPVVQNLQLNFNQAEVEVAALRGEIADRERTVRELEKLVDTVPQVEAEFVRLNRDYDVTRGQYTALVDRLERSQLGERASETESIRFEIIDQPSAPFKPVAPNRPFIMTAILLVGIGLGCGVAFLLHLLKPVFSSSRSLSEVTGLPVLGVVSTAWLDRYRMQARRSYVWLGVASALLIAVFAVALRMQPLMVQFTQQRIG